MGRVVDLYLLIWKQGLHSPCLFYAISCIFGYATWLVGFLVSRPGIEPKPSGVTVQIPNHWIAREFPHSPCLECHGHSSSPSPNPILPFGSLFKSCLLQARCTGLFLGSCLQPSKMAPSTWGLPGLSSLKISMESQSHPMLLWIPLPADPGLRVHNQWCLQLMFSFKQPLSASLNSVWKQRGIIHKTEFKPHSSSKYLPLTSQIPYHVLWAVRIKCKCSRSWLSW